MYKKLIRPILFLFDAESVHHFSFTSIRLLHKIPFVGILVRRLFSVNQPKLERHVFGIRFPNPIGLAAGFDKDAKLYKELSNFGFGFIEIGTLTPKPQAGNPKKRLFRLVADKGIINRMGFNNQGVDGLILVCAGAGGHAGALSPFALLREVKEWFDGTVILSGAIGDGHAVAASIALGADFAYMGTRFIATQEANADPEYKKMLEESAADDIVYSSLFTGVHGNYLKPSISNAGMDPDNLPSADKSSMNFGSGGNTKSKAWKDIWGSGQGIGRIYDSPPVSELVDRIKTEYEQAKEELNSK